MKAKHRKLLGVIGVVALFGVVVYVVVARTPYLGYTQIGNEEVNLYFDVAGSLFTSTAPGKVSHVKACLRVPIEFSEARVQASIFDETGLALFHSQQRVIVNREFEWIQLDFNGASINAGESYWITALCADGNIAALAYDSDPSFTGSVPRSVTGFEPPSFTPSILQRAYSIYLCYGFL